MLETSRVIHSLCVLISWFWVVEFLGGLEVDLAFDDYLILMRFGVVYIGKLDRS